MDGVDTVVHLAALDASIDAPEEQFFDVNVNGTWNVLAAAQRCGVRRVVLCSSVAAVGLGDARAPDFIPVDETHPCRPADTYGLSKQIGENIGACFARRGQLQVVCLRPAFVVFPELAAPTAQVLAATDDVEWDVTIPTNTPALGEPLTPTRAFIGPEDTARCFARAVEAELAENFSIYFVTAAHSMSTLPTLQRAEAMGMPITDVRASAPYWHDATASMFDCARAAHDLNWRAESSFATLLHEALGADSLAPDVSETAPQRVLGKSIPIGEP